MPEKDIGKGSNRADRIRITSDRMQFKFLLDTPDSYVSEGESIPVVNIREKDLIFKAVNELGIEAKDVIFEPGSGIISDNVQDAIEEVFQGANTGFVKTLDILVPTTSTTQIDSIPLSALHTAKWLIFLRNETENVFASCEVSALYKTTSIVHSRYAVLGDGVNYQIVITSDITNLILSITNNESYNLTVNILRFPTI